jgi:AraC family transcriptional regulator
VAADPSGGGSRTLGGLLDYLLWLADEPAPDWLAHAEQTIATLLGVFVAAPLPDHDAPDEHPALAAALTHVRQQWSLQMRPLTLAELAGAAGVSKEHLARLFQRRYGSGLIHALDLIRLDRAATLLARSNLTVTEIARTCGFADPLHFSKRFASMYGTPPRTFRRRGSRRAPVAESGLLSLASRLTHHLSAAV